MERVRTLCNKLKEQLDQHATVDDLLFTVQLLRSELTHVQNNQPVASVQPGVSIHVAPIFDKSVESTLVLTPAPEPEKTVEVLQIDEAEVEAELEEIKRIAEERSKFGIQNRPSMLFDPVEDIPTLTHQQPTQGSSRATASKPVSKELHQTITSDHSASLNDKLKQIKIELSDTLKEVPIKDLKKAIGLNDRFLFIRELFRGDETMYERSIKTINGFTIFPEAEYWIKRELKLKLAWDDHNEYVKQFDQLVKRRFA